jgi:hypothetical protein
VSVTLQRTSTIRSPLASLQITSDLFSILIVFHQFLTWTALGYLDLGFSPMFIRKANVVEEIVPHQHKQSKHITDGKTVMSLSASLLWEVSAAMVRLLNCVKLKIITYI